MALAQRAMTIPGMLTSPAPTINNNIHTHTSMENTLVAQELRFPDVDISQRYWQAGFRGCSIAAARSAVQKAIRQNDVEVARYWAGILLASHLIESAYGRPVVIASEDIGPADDSCISLAVKAYDLYKGLRNKEYYKVEVWRNMRDVRDIRLALDAVIRYLCSAEKSRVCDHACVGVVCNVYQAEKQVLVYPDAATKQSWEDAITNVTAATLKEAAEAAAKLIAHDGTTPILKIFTRHPRLTDVRAAMVAMSHKADPPFLHVVHGIYILAGASATRPAAAMPDLAHFSAEDEERVGALYREILYGPLSTPPRYATDDMHVKGMKPGDVAKFVEVQNQALQPKSITIVDPFYELARTTGAAAREAFHFAEKKRKKEEAEGRPAKKKKKTA
jgi:hypothetical protein